MGEQEGVKMAEGRSNGEQDEEEVTLGNKQRNRMSRTLVDEEGKAVLESNGSGPREGCHYLTHDLSGPCSDKVQTSEYMPG